MSRKLLYSHAHVPVGKSMTKQDGAETPGQVFKRYMGGAPIPEHPPFSYGDVSEFDYAEQRQRLQAFRTEFEELPSDLRYRFGNDPANYAEYLGENEEAIAENGLYAVLTEDLEKEEAEPPRDEIAQNGATDDESGSEQAI